MEENTALDLITDLEEFFTLDDEGNYQIDLDVLATYNGSNWILDVSIDDVEGEDNVVIPELELPEIEMDLPEPEPEPEPEPDFEEPEFVEPVIEPLLPEPEPEPVEPENDIDTSNVSNSEIAINFENHDPGTNYDFETQQIDWDAEWSSNDMNLHTEITNEESVSGNHSLKVNYPSDRQFGAGAGWKLESNNEYYLQYQVKFQEGFDFNGTYDWSSGGKLPGLGADGLCSGGSTCTGENGFTSRPMWRENGRGVLYLYHMNKEGQYGDDLRLQYENGDDFHYNPGQWHEVTQRVKINDGNQANGEVDVWIDGRQFLDEEGFQFVNNGQGVDRLFFNTFHGGNSSDWWPDANVDAYFDDFIATTNAADVGL